METREALQRTNDDVLLESKQPLEVVRLRRQDEAISLVEAAYGLGDTQSAWLERLVERAVPLLDQGGSVTAQIVRNLPAWTQAAPTAWHSGSRAPTAGRKLPRTPTPTG